MLCAMLLFRVIKLHNDTLREIMTKHGGYESQTEGVSLCWDGWTHSGVAIEANEKSLLYSVTQHPHGGVLMFMGVRFRL